MNPCPRCGGRNFVSGKLTAAESSEVVFRPDSLRILTITLKGGPVIQSECMACRDCGYLSTQVDKNALERFIARHCDEPSLGRGA